MILTYKSARAVGYFFQQQRTHSYGSLLACFVHPRQQRWERSSSSSTSLYHTGSHALRTIWGGDNSPLLLVELVSVVVVSIVIVVVVVVVVGKLLSFLLSVKWRQRSSLR